MFECIMNLDFFVEVLSLILRRGAGDGYDFARRHHLDLVVEGAIYSVLCEASTGSRSGARYI